MQLYSFFNSSTSYRVRIALALKQIAYECLPVDIRTLGHKQPEYVVRNPSEGVPLLVDDGFNLSQSIAIIDYLDAQYSEPRLIPEDTHHRARVLEIASLIGCDMHPLNNLKVLRYLTTVINISDDAKTQWYHHWIDEGARSLEALLAQAGSGDYCLGNEPTLADCCLIPQVANAQRMGCNLDKYSRVLRVYKHCIMLPAFQKAAPAQQPDYVA